MAHCATRTPEKTSAKNGRRLSDVGEASLLCPLGSREEAKRGRFAYAGGHFERNDVTIYARRCTSVEHDCRRRPADSTLSVTDGIWF
jgi:hypothetical protein